MRFAANHQANNQPRKPGETVAPVFLARRVTPQPEPEVQPHKAPRFLAWLDQLDPDQRVRAVGEW